MKESMRCAKTVAWNLLPYEIKKKIKNEWDEVGSFGLHIHCPDAAMPKDGPSAGIAITSAILSRLCNVKIRNNVAMTGEIDLNCNITKIGGLEYKLIGAIKAGITKIFICKENEENYKQIKKKNYKQIKNLNVIIVKNINDIVNDIF